MKFVASIEGRAHTVDVTGERGVYRVTIDDDVWDVDARLTAQGIYSLLIDGVSHVADVTNYEGACVVEVGAEIYTIDVEQQTRYIIRTRGGQAATGGGQILKAPMPGRVTHIAVTRGATVDPGDPLVVIEAMKMENEFKASTSGTVVDIRVEPGQAVNAGDVLIVIEAGSAG